MGLYDTLETKLHQKHATDIEGFLTGHNIQSEALLGRLAARLGRSGASLRAGKQLASREKYGAHQITTGRDIELEKVKIAREQEKKRKKQQQMMLYKTIGSIVGTVAGMPFGPGGATIGGALGGKLFGLKAPESELSQIMQFLMSRPTGGTEIGYGEGNVWG